MTTQHQGAPAESEPSKQDAGQGVDPGATDHPTGTEQADENAREESPS